MELSKEQISYLTSLDSKKKKRKFLLDCLVENIEDDSIKWFRNLIISGKVKLKSKDLSETIGESEIIEQKPTYLPSEKPNYSPEEIDLVKHNITKREVSEQGSKLLKFDKLEKDEFWKIQKEIESLKDKINQQNLILNEFEVQKDNDVESHEYCNTIINFSNLIVKCVNMQSDPTNILNQFLLSVNKYYYYKTKNTIDFIDELFPQLKNNKSAK